MKTLLVKHGRVIDPATKKDGIFDIFVSDGRIQKIAPNIKERSDEAIDAKGLIVAPGLIDIHVHLREPGREDEETVFSGSLAAVKGGFTSIACMPNTTPACDSQATAKFIIDTAAKNGLVNVFPVGAITKRREGKELAEIAELKVSGCVAISDDGDSVPDAGLMRRALEYAGSFGVPVLSHCEDKTLSEGGVMNEGFVSTVLGLKGMSNKSESMMIHRDIELAQLAGARLHIQHVSTKEGVELIRQAKKRGVKVTTEAGPHHFTLTDACCKTYDTNTKVNPPLRTAEDVEAVKEGLRDGTIDAIASDHAPHLDSEKDVEFDYAPFGMIGLETALALSIMELVDKKFLTWPQLIEKMSLDPARIIGVDRGTLKEGKAADITIIDPDKKWTYLEKEIVSKSKNSPFINWQLKGRATHVIVGGHILLADGALRR
jgi:dihydroorotase